MSETSTQAQAAPLIDYLTELAGEIDGIVDFGMTVCFIPEKAMAGRNSYIEQRCEAVRRLINSISAALHEPNPTDMPAPTLQTDLIAATDQLLAAFRALARFRSLPPDSVRAAAEAVRLGWETTHAVIRRIAEAQPLLDRAWYFPILERHQSYRTQLEGVCACFYETAIGSKTE